MSNRIIFILSLLGFIVTGFLTYEYIQKGPIVCPITGTGCDIVRKSSYSKLLGIDLPYLGLLFYITVATITIWLIQKNDKFVNKLRFLVSFVGFCFGVYLTFLEAFVILAWCIWCLTSFVISVIIFLICLKDLSRKTIQHEN